MIDRMLIAQAQIEDLPIVTDDEIFDDYGVTRLCRTREVEAMINWRQRDQFPR